MKQEARLLPRCPRDALFVSWNVDLLLWDWFPLSSRLDFVVEMLDTFAAHSKLSCKDCITAAITILWRHTSATSLAACQMANTVQVGFPYLQSLTHWYSIISVWTPSSPTFLFAPCDRPLPLTCTYLALISISVQARFILQLLPLFIRLKP